MQIHNIRLGFATNSSSSHSLIFLNNIADDYNNGSFGWDNFTLSNQSSKRKYLASILYNNISRITTKSIAMAVVNEWIGTKITLDGYGDNVNYIDHQSMICLPFEFGTSYPDALFIQHLKEYLLQDNLVILGGNDNEDDHPLANGDQFLFPLPYDYESNQVCRYDTKYGFWTIFNKNNGSKIRFSFNNKMEDFIPDRASAPELVDIKLTDYCPFGCSFCYQDSTTSGKDGDMDYIRIIAYKLSKYKVFEVALGGGEPTLMPGFVNILKRFKNYGITPNFTTKNMKWLDNNKLMRDIMENCGAFAYSISSTQDIAKLYAAMVYNDIPTSRCNIHIVMGTVLQYEFNKMLEDCNKFGFRPTLLGWKNVGRGKKSKPYDYHWWLTDAQKHKNPISIDTVLASQYEQELINANISPHMFHTKDGRFSCYIDAVSRKIGPSSFCEESEMVDFEYHTGLTEVMENFS